MSSIDVMAGLLAEDGETVEEQIARVGGNLNRRRFLGMVAAAAAAAGMDPRMAVAQAAGGRGRGGGRGNQPQEAPIPLGMGDPPAIQFMAYPGGTGAVLEKLWAEAGGTPFTKTPIETADWEGPIPRTEEEVVFLPAHRLGALVRAGHISSVDLTEMYLERMRRLDPLLLCTVNFLDGRAREEAQQADADLRAGNIRSPLHGVPWGVKDLFAVTGAPTAWGSEDFQDQVLDFDSELVVRLREAGTVLIAKLATGQFASGDNWYRGRTKNPWNPEQGSSGSSAGPGSATAAGCVGFSIGTETRGSIVSPSARNGLSALRPTFGRITRHGGMVLSWSMDKPGPMCRTIEDCAIVFNLIHGADEKDPATMTAPFSFDRNIDLSQVRIGYSEDSNQARTQAFVAKLREMGADLRPIGDRPDSPPSQLGVESAAAFEFYVDRQAAERAAAGEEEPEGGGRFTRGRDATAFDYLQTQRRRLIVMNQMAEFMEDLDMYVGSDTGLTNETGHPAVVVPTAFEQVQGRGGNPAGPAQPQTTTIVGQLFADDKLLSVAHAYQMATDWHTRHPSL